MRRIAVIGPVASGKTTLAHILGSLLSLPVIDLDEVYFGADHRFSDEEWQIVHRDLLKNDRWIIAGDYRGVANDRFDAADTIIWLDLSRLICLWRVIWRSRKFQFDCFRWIWRYPMRGREQTIMSLNEHAKHAAVFHLRSPRQVRKFVRSMERKG